MDILNLGGINEPSERPSKKKLKVIIGIGLLAGVMGMGSTLAASITLNGGTAVEFGQGVQLVAACDSEITLTPTAEFVNDTRTTQANFRLKTITLEGVSSNCQGKKLRINAYTNSDSYTAYTAAGTIASPIAFGWTYGTSTGNKFGGSTVGGLPKNVGCEIAVNATWASTTMSCALGAAGTDDTTGYSISTTTGTIVITFQTGSASPFSQPVIASAIDKFALESNA